MPRIDLGDLAALKVQLQVRVDAEAEVCRRLFVTPGSGQAMEYTATEAEARALVALADPGSADPADYPFLQADRAAHGGTPTLLAVADQVLAQADAWRIAGGAIKQLRLAAKRAIDAAGDATAARAAARVTWPAP
jgi:hypothetical protein